MPTIIGAEEILGQTIIGSIERGNYVYRHGGRVVARVPLARVARRMNVSGEAMQAIHHMSGRTEISGAFFNKIKKAAKSTVKAVAQTAKTVAKSKVTQALYSAAKAAAPSPLNQAIAASETAVKLGKAIAKGDAKGKKAAKAMPTIKALADGKISLAKAKAEAPKFGLKPNTIRDAAVAMKLTTAKSPEAKAVMAVVADIAKVESAQSRVVTAKSGRKYEILVKAI